MLGLLDPDGGPFRLMLDRADHATDVGSRFGRPFGELAHLVGNDGEAPPGLAGARRLDIGIERQQIGMLGNLVDDLGDRADLR